MLVVSVSGMGNTLLFTPALRVLRDRYPDAEIDVLVERKASRAILEANPAVNRVLELGLSASRLRALRLVQRLRASRYDLSFTAFPSNKPVFNALMLVLGARQRVIHTYRGFHASSLALAQTRTVPAVRGLHDIVQNLRLVRDPDVRERSLQEGIPRPVLHLSVEERRFARDYFASKLDAGPTVAVHPGSASGRYNKQAAKRWPAERFAAVIQGLREEMGANVLVFCGPDEPELSALLQRSAARAGLSGVHFPTAPVRRIAALIEATDAMITNDTGLMHVATAVRTPVVALFGPTNPDSTGPPWADCKVLFDDSHPCRPCLTYPFSGPRSDIPCSNMKCWESLTSCMVLDATKAILAEACTTRKGDPQWNNHRIV